MADFSIVKKGYDQDEVNEYISKLEDVIKSYKEKDVAIKNAIISAQVAADNIVKNAELEAMSRKYKTMEVLNSMRDDIAQQKNTLKNFQTEYNNMIKKYLIDFNEIEFSSLFNKMNELEENLVQSSNKLAGKKPEPTLVPEEPTKPINILSEENLI